MNEVFSKAEQRRYDYKIQQAQDRLEEVLRQRGLIREESDAQNSA